MNVLGRLIAIAAATVVAHSAAAQDPPTQTQPPQARQRMHPPGTGLQEGVTPQRLQVGMRGGRSTGLGLFAPRGLLDQQEFLGLNETQVQQLQALETELAGQRDKALADVRARQQELREAWNADVPDPKRVREKMKAAMDAQQAFELARVDAGARAKGILDAEQLGKVRGLAQGYRMGVGSRGGARSFQGRQGMRGPQGRGMMRGYRQPVPSRGRDPIR
jgi:Spy/CpxP family protein refolding chaperone